MKILRETEKVDVVIALSHGGVVKGEDGRYSDGEDVRLAKDVPGIDVVIGGHSHTELQRGDYRQRPHARGPDREGRRNLGELVITLDGDKLTVESYRLHPIDDTIAGDRAIAAEIEELKKSVTAAVFASRGYQRRPTAGRCAARFTQYVHRHRRRNDPGQPRHRLFREATTADIGFTANGMMRAGSLGGRRVCRPSTMCLPWRPSAPVCRSDARQLARDRLFHRPDLKNLLEFFLVDSPAHPGEYFPRASGMRFRYDQSRPKFDVVTAIELGDMDRGYQAIDISGKDEHLYSLTCPLMLAPIIVAIPKYTKGKLALGAQEQGRAAPRSKVEALDDPRDDTPYLLPPPGTVDKGSIDHGRGKARSARSRNGRRSWITCAACRSRTRANCP